MRGVIRYYRFINLLSFDIAAGAIASACYFASILQVSVRPYAIASLGLTVWIIYTADHLLDARKVKGRASTERHRFHQENFSVLVFFLVLAAFVDFILILFIKRPVLYGGFLILIIVGLYLVMHHRLVFLKEALVAALYCAGILLPSLPVTSVQLDQTLYVLIVLFFTTALINLLLFSWFDRENDQADKHQSFVTLLGEEKTRIVVLILFGVNAFLCGYGFIFFNNEKAFMIIMLMNLLLTVILIFRNWFAIQDRYRVLGDAIFLLPFLYLLR